MFVWFCPCRIFSLSFFAFSPLLLYPVEVILSSACVASYAKTAGPIFTIFSEKAAHGQQKKPLDFGGNPDHVT